MMKKPALWLGAALAAMALELVAAVPASAEGSIQHYGPYASGSTDSGTCGNNWANDTFNRHFIVQAKGSSFTVVELFADGAFKTPASDSPQPTPSPGACQASKVPAGYVNSGITGKMFGFFVIPMPSGAVQTSTDRSCVAGLPAAPCTTTGFIDSHFTPCYLDGAGTCPVTTFFFHYSARDQGLIQHEWTNASANLGGNRGDIRSVNA